MTKIKENSLYLLITEEYCRGRSALEIAKAAISGGVDIIQLREKNILRSDIAEIARPLADLCKKNNVIFIINDDPVLAKEIDADGVHLGQKDLKLFTVDEARNLLGPDKIIGLSAGSAEEVRKADLSNIDYIGFGPVFCTAIKEQCVGTQDVGKALKITKKPIFFIGGINIDNIDELLTKGAKNIAVIRAISEADDVIAATAQLKANLTNLTRLERRG